MQTQGVQSRISLESSAYSQEGVAMHNWTMTPTDCIFHMHATEQGAAALETKQASIKS